MQDERGQTQLPAPMSGGPAGVMSVTGGEAAPTERIVPRQLDAAEKAAVVVRLLLNDGAELPLEDLPDDLQARLTESMGGMGLVDRVTLAAVVSEFSEALDSLGLSFPHDIAGALSALDGKISARTAARLRKEAGVRQAGDPWKRLQSLPTADLAAIAQAECTEVAAVLLSKLDVPKAAELLGLLPGPLARRIAYAVSRTGAVTPDAVDRIGLSLASQLDDRPERAFDARPGERVGAILNQSPQNTREDVLTGLEETDAEFAESVRRAIFIFAHIPDRLNPRDVPLAIRATDPGALVTALSSAMKTGGDTENRRAAEYLLENMSTRMADNLRDEIEESGPVKSAEGERAMTEVVSAIRRLEQSGEIELATGSDASSDEAGRGPVSPPDA